MAEDTRIGTQLADYRIESLIGHGGMSVVYLAEHERLHRRVALKLLAPQLADDPRFRERFLHESTIAASIDHPNIIPIYDADESEGTLYIAMRYVDGTDLSKLIHVEGRLDPERTVSIIGQVANALDVAHERDLVHRDVKPGNILISRGTSLGQIDHVYLTDFGLTKRPLSVSGSLTETGQLVGTIDYVAPEQIRGDPVDGRADMYSLGCVLYHCLVGEVPYPRDTEVAVMWAHVQTPPPTVTTMRPEIPRRVDDVVATAMAKKAGDRFATGAAMVADLRGSLGLAPGGARRRKFGGPAPLSRVRRHPALTTVVALALVAAVAVPITIALRGGGPGERIAGDAVGIIDLESGELEGSVPLASRPGAVATGEGSVWVTLPDEGAVIEIDAETMSIVDTVPVGSNPVGIAVGADSVWVANGGNSTVSRISPAKNNEVVDPIPVPGAPTAIAVNDEGVWVADSFGDAVTPIDPESGDPLASVPVGDQPVDLVDDGGELWVANAGSGSVSRVLGGDEVQPLDVGEGPQAVAVGAGAIWVANSLDGTVSRIDPDTNSTDTTRVGEGLTDLAYGGGSLWVSLGSAGSIKRIDPLSDSGTTIALGSYAGSVALGEGALWVSMRGPVSAHRGGTLRVVMAPLQLLDSIDPALAYIPLTWGILSLTNDGLVGLRRVGGVEGTEMVPNLARSIPEPTDGGRTYTFQLRPGIRYSSGEPVRPQDFRRAIERLYSLGSGGSFYFDTIVGAQECQRREPCDLYAGIETDDNAGTVTFHLVEPDPDFLNKLTMSFAFAVPAGTLDKPAKFTPIPATGPYMIERYTKGKSRGNVVLVRNPEFRLWSEARPDGFADRILFRLDPDSLGQRNEAVDEVLDGDADFMWAFAPAGRLAELMTTYAGQFRADPTAGTRYMFLNAQTPPFNDVRVRRALNYAIDRELLIEKVSRIVGGVGRITCQILPPNFPGYEPYCPYTRNPDEAWTAPDLAKARQLVDASGTAGARVTVWAAPDAFGGWTVPPSKYFVRVLEQLGYDGELKVVSVGRYFTAINDPSQHVQIGTLAWGPDYFAESGFIPAVTCETATIGFGPGFCPPTIERRIEEATNMQLTDAAASHALWSDLDHDLVDRAAWVPLWNSEWAVPVSERIENYQFHPYWGPLYEHMWVR